MAVINEGPYGITDPQLWVMDASAIPAVRVDGTEIIYDSASPAWITPLHVQVPPSGQVCFEIRDDWPTVDPPLLHSGCGTISMGVAEEQSVVLSGGATVYLTICPSAATISPPSSPSPLLPEAPPLLPMPQSPSPSLPPAAIPAFHATMSSTFPNVNFPGHNFSASMCIDGATGDDGSWSFCSESPSVIRTHATMPRDASSVRPHLNSVFTSFR